MGVSCRSLIRQHSRCHFASLLADRTLEQTVACLRFLKPITIGPMIMISEG
ncbi:MAG: hypothetical protein WJ306_06400 [Ferrovum myxofaciens]